MLVCPLRAPTRTKASSTVGPASAEWRRPTSSHLTLAESCLTSAACLSLESPTMLPRKPSGVRHLGVRHLFRRLRRSTARTALVDMRTASSLRLGHPVRRTACSRCRPTPPHRRHVIRTVQPAQAWSASAPLRMWMSVDGAHFTASRTRCATRTRRMMSCTDNGPRTAMSRCGTTTLTTLRLSTHLLRHHLQRLSCRGLLLATGTPTLTSGNGSPSPTSHLSMSA